MLLQEPNPAHFAGAIYTQLEHLDRLHENNYELQQKIRLYRQLSKKIQLLFNNFNLCKATFNIHLATTLQNINSFLTKAQEFRDL